MQLARFRKSDFKKVDVISIEDHEYIVSGLKKKIIELNLDLIRIMKTNVK